MEVYLIQLGTYLNQIQTFMAYLLTQSQEMFTMMYILLCTQISYLGLPVLSSFPSPIFVTYTGLWLVKLSGLIGGLDMFDVHVNIASIILGFYLSKYCQNVFSELEVNIQLWRWAQVYVPFLTFATIQMFLLGNFMQLICQTVLVLIILKCLVFPYSSNRIIKETLLHKMV